jgi:serine/threonine protein phosphatase 1
VDISRFSVLNAMARYVIGDVHGCVNTMRELIENRLQVSKTDTVILLGDYVDRGPHSMQVLDYLLALINEGYGVIPLRGNHDDLLIQGRFSADVARMHLVSGGSATLDSFGVSQHEDIPLHYCDFIDSLPFYHEEEDFVFVHASLNLASENPYSDYESMLWSRLEIDDNDKMGRRVVAGHTPQTIQMIVRRIDSGRKIILDSGCCYPEREGLGTLCSLDLDTLSLQYVKNIDYRY